MVITIVHIWLPRAHAEAPLAGSILLASVFLKLAVYGFLRVLINFLPDATNFFSPLVQTIAIVSLIYSSLATIRQSDLKRLVAYSSVSHMAIVVLGLFSNTIIGIEGAILLSIAHGFISPAMFAIVGGVLYDRRHTRIIRYYRGTAVYMPVFALLFFLATVANMGIPLSLNWRREYLSLAGIFQRNPVVAVLGATGIVLSACYSIFLFNRVAFGSYSQYLPKLNDVSRREFMLLFRMLLPAFIFGFFPNVILNDLHVGVTELLYSVSPSGILQNLDESLIMNNIATPASIRGLSIKKASMNRNPSLRNVVSILRQGSIGEATVASLLESVNASNITSMNYTLSPNGVTAIFNLARMINTLHGTELKYSGDKVLLGFIRDYAKVLSQLEYHFDLDAKSLKPLINIPMPVKAGQPVLSKAGVYALTHLPTQKMSVGSSIHFQSRTKEHAFGISSSKDKTSFQRHANRNGGLPDVGWSPLVSVQSPISIWTVKNSRLDLSLGGTIILRAVAQLPVRVLEQNIMCHYKPHFNQYSDLVYFNFRFNSGDLYVASSDKVYQVWDSISNKLLLELSSLNSVAKYTNVSIATVRNNLDWHKPLNIEVDGVPIKGIIRVVGNPLRNAPLKRQLPTKGLYPLLELKGRTLYDLKPGYVHIINMGTLEDVATYNSQEARCRRLNPSKDFDKLSDAKRIKAFHDRLGKFINLAKPNSNELGTFYYARHPNWVLGKTPGSYKAWGTYYLINLNTGLCHFHTTTRSLTPTKSNNIMGTIKTRVPYKDLLVMFSGEFTSLFPEALTREGRTYQLDKTMLSKFISYMKL